VAFVVSFLWGLLLSFYVKEGEKGIFFIALYDCETYNRLLYDFTTI